MCFELLKDFFALDILVMKTFVYLESKDWLYGRHTVSDVHIFTFVDYSNLLLFCVQ